MANELNIQDFVLRAGEAVEPQEGDFAGPYIIAVCLSFEFSCGRAGRQFCSFGSGTVD